MLSNLSDTLDNLFFNWKNANSISLRFIIIPKIVDNLKL